MDRYKGKEETEMRILSWNGQGLGDDSKNTLVYNMLLDCAADFVCIQETKLREVTKFKAAKFLPPIYTGLAVQPSEGASAGLLIAWNKKKYDGVVTEQSKHHITLAVSSTSSDEQFQITNIYAPCDSNLRTEFFGELRQLKQAITGKWMLVGDFNIYRYSYEKNNENVNWTAMSEFNDWINEMEMMDIEVANRLYTWTNKRRQPTLVRLDRVLINLLWSQFYINTECRALVKPTSDHTPLQIDTSQGTPRRKIFRYENS